MLVEDQHLSHRSCVHFVDFFIVSQNRMIEIKSNWTFELHRETVFVKQQAAKAQGFQYDIWVFDKTGKLVTSFT